jgi:hypothetical protein
MADFTPILVVLAVAGLITAALLAGGLALVVAGVIKNRKTLWVTGVVLVLLSFFVSAAIVAAMFG